MQLASSRRPAIASHGYTAIQRYTLYSYTALYSIHAIHHPSEQVAQGTPEARILVLEADLRSALGNSLPAKATRADIVSVALFRDAASAGVVCSGDACSASACYEMVTGGSRIVPHSHHLVMYREQRDGSIKLHLDQGLPDAVAAAEPAFVERLLCEAAAAGAAPPELDVFDIACHTGGPRVLQEVAAALGASDEQFASSWAVMKAHGNLSGAASLAVLDHLNRRTHGLPLQRRWVLCLSMGPGACLEGLVLRPPRKLPPRSRLARPLAAPLG